MTTEQKPAEPVTEAGKALDADEYNHGQICPKTAGGPRSRGYPNAVCDCGFTQLVVDAEAQAQELLLSDVEGLAPEWFAQAVIKTNEQVTGVFRPRASELFADALWRNILAAWRQSRKDHL